MTLSPARRDIIRAAIEQSNVGPMLVSSVNLIALEVEMALFAEEERVRRLSEAGPALHKVLAELKENAEADLKRNQDDDGPGGFWSLKTEQAIAKADKLLKRIDEGAG